MILKMELDLENPVKSAVYLDDKKIGGLDKVTLGADIARDSVWAELQGTRMRDTKEKAAASSGTFTSPTVRFSKFISRNLFGPIGEYTEKSLADLAETLKDNLKK